MNPSDQTFPEQVSALLDDELGPSEQQEVLSALSGNPNLAETWQRYHLIRAVVKREEIVFVPGLPERKAPLLNSNVQPIKPESSRPRPNGRWLPGLAIAASVAGLVSLGLFGFLPHTDTREGATTSKVAEAVQGTKWNATSPDHERTLNAFLVEHGEFTPMPNMNGLMAYARFVSYDSDH